MFISWASRPKKIATRYSNMGSLFSSEPVQPLLPSNGRVAETSRYSTLHPKKHAFDVFERPPGTLDTVYEHEKERESVPDHPVEDRENFDQLTAPHQVQYTNETNEKIYYNNVLDQIQDISKKEFYDLRRVDVKPVIVTDDIVLRRHRSSRRKSKR